MAAGYDNILAAEGDPIAQGVAARVQAAQDRLTVTNIDAVTTRDHL